jgi:predicted transcriptional regulator
MSMGSVAVSNIMVRDVKIAKENQSINAIAKVMSDNNIGSVVIVKSDDDLG